MMEIYQQVPPWSWSLEKRLEYATSRFDKLVNIYPVLAEKWLREVELIKTAISNHQLAEQTSSRNIDTSGTTTDHNRDSQQ
jgi:hypothetical protein